MYNPNTYGWYQCDEEDYDSGTPPEEQMATEPQKSNEKTILEAIDRLVRTGPVAFPLSLTAVREESKLGVSAFVRAMRALRQSGDVKVLNGAVTFAVNAYLYPGDGGAFDANLA